MKNTIRKISDKEYELSVERPLGKEELALGVGVRRDIVVPKDYLEDIQDFTDVRDPSNIHGVIKLCNRLIYSEPILGTAVEILMCFMGHDLKIEDVNDKEADQLLQHFVKHVNEYNENAPQGIAAFIDMSTHEWCAAGNEFPLEIWVKTDLEKTRTEPFDPFSVKDPEKYNPVKNYPEGGEYILPMFLNFLNPLTITVKDLSQVRRPLWVKPNPKLIAAAKGRGKVDKSILEAVPKYWIKYLKEGKDVPLDQRFVTQIGRLMRTYDEWGVPYLSNSFPAIAALKRLRRLDNSTIDGLINMIIVFKLGTEDKPASRTRLMAFSQLLRRPDTSNVLVWGHDVEFISVGPNNDILGMDNRFQEANEEIFDALGIPKFLISGREKFSGEPWEHFLLLNQKLESHRLQIESYLTSLFRKIMLAQKKKKFQNVYPRARLTRTAIRNEQEFRSFVLRLYDRGGIGVRTMLEEAGYDYDAELERKKEQKKEDPDGSLHAVPGLPFSGGPTDREPSPSPQGGRPDTPGGEREEESPFKKEQTASFAERGPFEKGYHDALMNIFNAIRNRLYEEYEQRKEVLGEPLTMNQIQAELLVGFAQLKRLGRETLGGIFDEYYLAANPETPVNQHILKQKLIAWNDQYLDKFMNDLGRKLYATSVIEDIEMAGAALLGIFAGEQSRMELYGIEGPRAGEIFGQTAFYGEKGYAGGFIRTVGDDRVCDACGSNDGEWYTMDELSQVLDIHPNCRCTVEYTKENKVLSGEIKKEKIVRIHPRKGGKIL